VRVVALSNDETLLVLKLVFLVLLYGFILLVVRSATKDIGGAPQESIILGASEVAKLREQATGRAARFMVLDGPELRPGSTVEVLTTTVVGRGPESGVRIDRDEFASAQHARIGTGPKGVWVEDLGSTNGTFVNGDRVSGRRVLQAGDVLRVGQTELQLEP
jgi:hypothetical protein